MNEPKLLGATLLHTRYGHWRHPKSGRLFIRPVGDKLRNYPGLVQELLAIRRRALNHEQTIHDQQRIQWLSQACFGALDIYQHSISTLPVERHEILEEIEDWFAGKNDELAAAFFVSVRSDT